MNELCAACLCSGRNLYRLKGTEVHGLYTQILNEISISGETSMLHVCWECRAILYRFQKFKKQAQDCYTELLENTTINPHISNLQPYHLHVISYPEENIKVEVEDVDIKNEATDDNDTQHEPETFVSNILVDQPKSKDVKVKKVKTIKRKAKQKVRLKKKKKLLKQKKSSDIESDFECLDTTEVEKEFVCKECGLNFGDEIDMEKHLEIEHTVKDPVKPNGVTRTRHRRPLPDKPQCLECGKMFSSKKTYRYHFNVLHKGQNRYPCPRCEKVYQWKSNLGRHMRSHKAHDDGELYCRACDKRFASVATYRQHLRVSRRHVTEKDFTFMCNECGKKFVSKIQLRDHIDWDHLNKIKFRCQVCNKPFKCHTSLYVHMQNVHKSKESKENLCHVCGKSYPNKAKLKYHIVAMHTSETPYQCEQCSAAFGWYSSLYRHVREVHYKMKLQPNKMRKKKLNKTIDVLAPPKLLPMPELI